MTREELLALIDRAADEGWTELDLSGQGLTELPGEIGKLSQLETLILGKVERWEWMENKPIPTLITNQLTALPPELAALENLQTLNLSGNPLVAIPEVVLRLRQLKSLNLTSLGLSEIPAVIGNLTKLTELGLHSNQITEIPAVIGNLTKLTELDLHNNQITEIPAIIGNLTSLTTLYLSSNQITEIPAIIGNLTSLTTLHLSNNQITEIPAIIGNLTKLMKLYFSSNQITEIPAVIGNLTNLMKLYLHSNQITEIPAVIGNLTSLTELYLYGNQITEIPAVIGNLTSLAELDLYGNQITEIPAVIGNLTSLATLYLYGNQITEIPAIIGNLTSLTKLYLSNNQITEIPQAIAALTNLEKLKLANNQIETLPNWLEELPKLKILDLRGNPLPISPEVLGSPNLSEAPGSVEGIFNYCRQLRSGEVRPLNEAKLLLIGQGSVGKTSLVNHLIDRQFNPREPQTDGLTVRTWNIRANSKDVRLNVWDFGGQEIYHATHQFFLTKRSLYLLVCNCRTSEDQNRIEYWLKLIESFGDQSPVIIVGNKKDEQPLDINRKALRDKYPNIKAILETSCQTNDGIDALREAITREVAQLSDVYNLLPLSWFEVKEHLEAMDQDFISYPKYACICEAKAVTEEQNQEQLINLLHNLGLVLNFRDHPILQSTNVLNPNWVTQGIYALLSDETLKTETKGILAPADLSRILDPQRYPTQRHPYLTELMKEFQLCFALPDSHKFLIPGLLPKDEPQATDLAGDTLEFQYHYRILPESIISRFIVLTHAKIHNHTYWRSGVMLDYTEGNESCNIARIKADPEDKIIFISISGRETMRRSFLFYIRDVFNRIHNSFANLEITEYVPVPNYPDHPPLDYQELLGLEKMGIRDYPIGKLNITVDIRQLLDGYEAIELRQRQRMGEAEHHHHYGDVIYGDKVGNDKIGSDKIGRDKIQGK